VLCIAIPNAREDESFADANIAAQSLASQQRAPPKLSLLRQSER
jgi:hypothetical protein